MKKKPFLIATGFTMFYFSFNASWQADPVKVEGGKHSYKKLMIYSEQNNMI